MKLTFLEPLLDLIYPPKCTICSKILFAGEDHICLDCMLHLPLARLSYECDNWADKLFFGIVEFEKVLAYMHYSKGADSTHLLRALKYQGKKELGEYLGMLMANNLPQAFFQGIDYLVPVPLHKSKLKLRGYNQSEWIAKGISKVHGIPLLPDALIKNNATASQTTKDVIRRRWQEEHLYSFNRDYNLEGMHIILIDDVLTTGATLIACREALNEVQGLKVSALTFALAHE